MVGGDQALASRMSGAVGLGGGGEEVGEIQIETAEAAAIQQSTCTGEGVAQGGVVLCDQLWLPGEARRGKKVPSHGCSVLPASDVG